MIYLYLYIYKLLLCKCLLTRFACQQRVLKTFLGPDVPRFGNGEVGS